MITMRNMDKKEAMRAILSLHDRLLLGGSSDTEYHMRVRDVEIAFHYFPSLMEEYVPYLNEAADSAIIKTRKLKEDLPWNQPKKS